MALPPGYAHPDRHDGDESAVRRIAVAAEALRSMTSQCADERRLAVARGELQEAINAARDVGVSWQAIGGAAGSRSRV